MTSAESYCRKHNHRARPVGEVAALMGELAEYDPVISYTAATTSSSKDAPTSRSNRCLRRCKVYS